MKLTLDALQVLDAIDRRGSFSAAAEVLNRVPSAVTYTVRKLEDDLDVLLFDRSGHRARLTPAGRELLEQGRSLLSAAADLECRVKRVATGWETELRIAVEGLVPFSAVYPLVARFYAAHHATEVRFSHEVLGGAWEALRDGRADLVIGAPAGAGMLGEQGRAYPLGEVDLLLAMAPSHPLAREPQPLTEERLRAHRIVVVADSSRRLPPRSIGILEGQATLTVPDMAAKLEAIAQGLGIGRLPRWMAEPLAHQGRLRLVETDTPHPRGQLQVLAPKRVEGKALKWWLAAVRDPVWWQGWQAAAAARAPVTGDAS